LQRKQRFYEIKNKLKSDNAFLDDLFNIEEDIDDRDEDLINENDFQEQVKAQKVQKINTNQSVLCKVKQEEIHFGFNDKQIQLAEECLNYNFEAYDAILFQNESFQDVSSSVVDSLHLTFPP
jgi:hypothetical protein